jgi:hypothetical protein
MIRVRPFEPGDLTLIRGREYELEMMRLAGTTGEHFAVHGPAFTMLDSQTAVMAAGVYILWPGVGEAWMHLSSWFYRHVKTAYREVGEILAQIIIQKSLRRVQVPVCASMPANRRFVEHLGFAPEGLMHRWGPEGKDYWLMSIVAPQGESLCRLRR